MEFINLFRKTLLENGSSARLAEDGESRRASKVTVKNYIADVKKFVSWFEMTFQRNFPPPALPLEVVEAYLAPIRASSPRSAKRYESSLRKFFTFLSETSATSYNPLTKAQQLHAKADLWYLKEFNNHLYNSKASPATIKNYIHDIRQFLQWAQAVTRADNALQQPDFSNWKGVFAKINSFLLEEYKIRLLHEAQLSPLSINRKLSSLRKYLDWAGKKGLLRNKTEFTRINSTANRPKDEAAVSDLSDLRNLGNLAAGGGPPTPDTLAANNSPEPLNSQPPYSRFGPLRLIQKSTKALNLLFDGLVILSIFKAIEAVKYNFWKTTGRKVFAPLTSLASPKSADRRTEAGHLSPLTSALDKFITASNIPKSIYAPYRISTETLSLREKIIYHLKHSRPMWYKKYHSYAFSHYFHFAILLVFASYLGFGVYQSLNRPQAPQLVLGSQISAGRLISFQGRLNDSQDAPIARKTPVRFAIYNSLSGSRKLWQENQIIEPNQEGSFATILGRVNKIEPDIFSGNPNLYLGIAVGSDPELTPRQELANAGLAKSAEELQGLKPITGNNAGTENVILALDSSGNLTIGGNANPIFQATGGEFKLSGQQLTLATNEGSNTNIVLAPDGTGIIDVQKPLQNTSEDNTSRFPGAVQINDNLAVIATTSSQSALAINQNGTGDLISAASGDTAKFSVSNSGSGSFAGDLSVLGNNLTTVTGTFNIANTNTQTLNIGGAATKISLGAKTGDTTINHDLNVAGVIKAEKGLILAGFTPGSIPFIGPSNQLTTDSQSLFWDQNTKRLGIGTSTPASKLSVAGMGQGAGTALVIDAGGNIFQASSSRRYKDNITDLNIDFDKILDASPVSFRYKDLPAGRQVQDSFDIGYIAEDFDRLGLKDLVLYNKEGQPDAIKYDKIGLYLIEIVKKQQKDLAALKKNSQMSEKLAASIQEFVSTIKSGVLEVKKISIESLSVATEDITIGAQTLREYITSIVNEILDKRLAEEKDKTIIVISPLAKVSAEASTSATLEATKETEETNEASPAASVSSVPSVSSSSSANITNIINIYSNGTIDSEAFATPTPSVYPTPVIILEANPEATESAEVEIGQNSNIASENQKTASDEADLVNPTNLLNGRFDTLNGNITQNLENVNNQTRGVDLPGVEPGRSGVSNRPSKPAKPTPNLSYQPNTNHANIATFSAELAYIPNLKSDFLSINQGLIALGPTSLVETSINGELTIGSNLKINETSINTIGADLSLQPLRQGNLSIMSGLVNIDTEGNLTVEGNATFARDVNVRGVLAAGIISPISDSDLVIQLRGKTQNTNLPAGRQAQNNAEQRSSELVVVDQNGSSKLRINNQGDVVSSGSGIFANLKLVRGAQADTSFTETVASGSAGTAVITASEIERTILTPFVTENSLIYITLVTDTKGITPYIARQTAENAANGVKGSFTIQIPAPQAANIKVNWIIVN